MTGLFQESWLRTNMRKIKNVILPGSKAFRKVIFGPASGCTLLIDFHYEMPLYLGYYEIELNHHIKQLVRAGYKCFDVGAQNGYDSLILAKLSGSTVISFDCDQNCVNNMTATFAKNSYQIIAHYGFVSDQSGLDKITLDEAANQYFIPDFIKIDIEGFELNALKGASGLLSSRCPNLIVETHSLETEINCIQFLKSFGYDPAIVNQRTFWKDRRLISHNRWLICRGKD